MSLTHRFEYDGTTYEAELTVIPGVPEVPAMLTDPGQPGEGPVLELKRLWRFTGRDPEMIGAEHRNLWNEVEEYLNDDVAHILNEEGPADGPED